MYLLFSILDTVLSLVIFGSIIAWYVTTKSKLKDLEDVRKNAQGLLKGLGSIEEIREKMNLLIGRVDAVSDRVDTLSDEMIASRGKGVYQSDSPLSLNEYGESLSKKIDVKTITDRYREELTKKAKKQEMNAYQIQQSCFHFAQDQIPKDLEENSKEQYDQLSNVAFKEGIHIRDLMRVIGLILRDQVLEACDIYISDVDSKTRKSAVGVADTNPPNNYSK